MSSSTATRTPRFTPPLAPTRKPTPRRRTVGQGASLVGRVDRPVLRIVSDHDGAPVVTRVRPVSPGALVEPVETLPCRVDLDEFFAPEYDGDDQAVEIAVRRPSSMRLTQRGRLVVLGVGLAAALGLALVAATGSLADDKPEPTRVVTVQPGQTLWDVAARVSGGDVRSTMAHLEALNHLDTTTLQVGQQLRVPR
jgi:nucleoid-associated protein YgaU